jgi:hypothetical protein
MARDSGNYEAASEIREAIQGLTNEISRLDRGGARAGAGMTKRERVACDLFILLMGDAIRKGTYNPNNPTAIPTQIAGHCYNLADAFDKADPLTPMAESGIDLSQMPPS